jgi:hypothetical protein
MFYILANKKSELIIKQKTYLAMDRKPDILLIGDSRTVCGIDESGYKNAFSMAYYGEGYMRNYFRLKNVFEKEKSFPKIIVMQLEALRFTKGFSRYKSNNYFYYNLYSPWDTELSWKDFFKEAQRYYYSKLIPYSEIFSMLKQNELEFNIKINKKFSSNDSERRIILAKKYFESELTGKYLIENLYYPETIEYLKKTVALCKQNKVKMIFVKFPLTREILGEMTRTLGENCLKGQPSDKTAAENNIPVIDLQYIYADRPDFFVDCHHLNNIGRNNLTPLVMSKIDSVIKAYDYIK